MYRLTPRMLQHFERDLKEYHKLFDGGRCSGWELEELVVKAIKSDTVAEHHTQWREAGHDDKEDIRINTKTGFYTLQIKSGRVTKKHLTLSGHRLGRFGGDKQEITDYLNSRDTQILAVPYEKRDDETGRTHIYWVTYVDTKVMSNLKAKNWHKKGKQLIQTNKHGVEFSLRPSMSWQIWWKIPIQYAEKARLFEIR